MVIVYYKCIDCVITSAGFKGGTGRKLAEGDTLCGWQNYLS